MYERSTKEFDEVKETSGPCASRFGLFRPTPEARPFAWSSSVDSSHIASHLI